MASKKTKTADNQQEIVKCLNKYAEWVDNLYLTRKEIFNTNYFFNTVFAWIYNIDTNKILIETRSRNKMFNPGEIGLVGGHVVKDESFYDCLVHECNEEIKFKAEDFVPIYLGVTKPINDQRNFSHNYLFFINSETKITYFQKEEVEKIEWIDFDLFYKNCKKSMYPTITWKNNKKILKNIKNFNKLRLKDKDNWKNVLVKNVPSNW